MDNTQILQQNLEKSNLEEQREILLNFCKEHVEERLQCNIDYAVRSQLSLNVITTTSTVKE